MARLAPIVALTAVLVAIATGAPAPPPTPSDLGTCCPGIKENNILDNRGMGSINIYSDDGYLWPNGAVTLAAWVRMAPERQSGRAYIFTKTTYAWDNVQSGYSLYWDHDMGRLQLEMTTAEGHVVPANAAGTGPGNVYLANGKFHLVTLQLDSQTGAVQAWIDLVPDLFVSFPAGSQVNHTRSLTIGCKDYARGCVDGYFADLFTANRTLDPAEREKMYSYRQCPQRYYNGAIDPASGVLCDLAQPIPQIRQYVAGRSRWNRYEGPNNTYPSAYMLSATDEPPFQTIAATHIAEITKPSYTEGQKTSGRCTDSKNEMYFTLSMTRPVARANAYQVTLTIAKGSPFTETDTISIYAGTSTTADMMLAQFRFQGRTSFTFTVPSRHVSGDGKLIPLAISAPASAPFCPNQINHVDHLGARSITIDATAAGGNFGFAGETISATVLSTTPAGRIGLIPATETDCSKAMYNTTITPGLTSAPPSVIFTSLPSDGNYTMCVVPEEGPGIQSAYMLPTVGNFTDGSLMIAPLPDGGAPLRNAWITDMLRLGSRLDSAIPNGQINVDYFAAVGGEAALQPKIYDTFNDGDTTGINGGNLTWTPTTQTSGTWGEVIPNTAVDYLALAVYSPVTQDVTFAVRHNYAAQIWLDGDRIYSLTIPDAGQTKSTGPVSLAAGWHQFMIKYNRFVNVSYFKLRPEQAYGLSWAFEIPGAKGHGSVSYNNTCVLAGTPGYELPCIPGANVPEGECFNIGCCWSAGRCYAQPNSQLPYRRDGRCGPGYPAPASPDYGQCDKDNSVGASCCSPHEWCGNSVYHCTCPLCVNYRYDDMPRCRYASVCKDSRRCSCGSTTPIFVGNFSMTQCQETCDFDDSCKGFQYTNAGSCYFLAEECRFAFSDDSVYDTRNRYCNCTFRDDGKECPGGGCRCSNLAAWLEMPGRSWTAADCEAECAGAFHCSAYNWINGSCYFLREACNDLVQSSAPATYKVYSCPGISEPVPTLPSNASLVDSAAATILGCYDDPFGTLLLERPSMPTVNLYTGSTPMTPQVCEDYCISVGALFFGLNNATKCMCGMRQRKHDYNMVREKECKLHCPGNSSLACGGLRATLMYTIAPSTVGCGDNAYRFRDSCYTINNQTMNFSRAVEACTSMGGQLASAQDIPTAQFAMALPFALNLTDSFKTYRMWIGAAADNSRGHFDWIDGSAWTVSSWRIGEPNSFATEDCVEALTNYASPWGWKGTWNNVDCDEEFISVCRTAVPPATLPPASVQVAAHRGRYACSTKGIDAGVQSTLAINLPLASSLVNSVNGGPQPVLVRNVSQPTVQPNFAHGFTGGPARYLSFTNGDYYLNITDSRASPPQDAFTVCAWVVTASTEDSTIIAKVRDAWWLTSYEYKIGIRFGQLCFSVGYYHVCLREPVLKDGRYHVCGIRSAARIAIYVNGVKQSQTSAVYMDASPAASSLIIGAEATNVGSPNITRPFTGFIADLRFYTSELGDSDIMYLGTACGYTDVGNKIPVYLGKGANVTLFGHGMYTMARAQSTVHSCGESTGIGGRSTVFLHDQGTESAIVNLHSRALMSRTANVSLCLNAPGALISGDFPVDTGVKLVPVAVDSFRPSGGTFADGALSVTVETKDMTHVLTIVGANFDAMQSIVLASDAECTQTIEALPMMNIKDAVAPGKVEATIVFSNPMQFIATLYVCWSPAMPDTAGESVASYPTPLTINMRPSAEVQLLATTTGGYAFGPSDFILGASFTSNDYSLPCTKSSFFTNATVVQVQMGAFVDYYILRPGVTSCQFLSNSSNAELARYSAVNPLSDGWDGTQYMIPGGDPTLLGSSAPGFPVDGRTFLSSWGSTNPDNAGGCCASQPGQAPGWGRPFTITALGLPKNNVYLRVAYPPTTIYRGVSYTVTVELINAYGDKYDDGQGGLQHFYFECDGAGSDGHSHEQVAAGMATFTRRGTTAPAGSIMTCNATTSFAVANRGTVSFQVIVADIQPNGLALDSGELLPSLLKLGRKNQALTPLNGSKPISQDLLAVAGGEANVRPQPFQTIRTNDATSASYQWLVDASSNGIYGEEAPKGPAVLYYAFGLYAPSDQYIELVLKATSDSRAYVDGSMFATARGGSTTTSPAFRVLAGWHQVVIKIVAKNNAQPQLSVAAKGSGLQHYMSLPSQLPEGASSIPTNSNLELIMHLGSTFDAVVNGEFSAVTAVPPDARPKIGDVAGGLTWGGTEGPMTTSGTVFPWPKLSTSAKNGVAYYAIAIYASAQWAYSFEFGAASSFEVFMDGIKVVDRADNTQNTAISQDMYLSAGWHQFIFKLGALKDTTNAISFYVRVSTGGLGWAFEVPAPVPNGATAVPTGPLTHFLQLEGSMASVPNMAFQGIPYDPTAATGDGVVPPADFTLVNNQPTAGKSQPISTGAGSQTLSGFTWQARSDIAGRWGEGGQALGGGYTSYWATQLYSPSNQTVVPKSTHYGGLILYLDGAVVSNDVSAVQNSPQAGTPFLVTKGWHTLIMRLTVPTGFTLATSQDVGATTGPAPVTWSNASAVCTKQRLELCQIQAYCPYGRLRADGAATPNASAGTVWAPVRGATAKWVQLSAGDGQCTVSAATPPASQRMNVGCCGNPMHPWASLELSGEALATAYDRPPPPLPVPVISVVNSDSSSPTVTISTDGAAAVILYTLDGTAPSATSGIRYTEPFSVTSPTLVKAVTATADLSRTSPVAAVTVSPASVIVAGRTDLVVGASTPIALTRAVPGDVVALVASNDPRLPQIRNSVNNNVSPDGQYTGTLQVQGAVGAAYVVVPGSLQRGTYTMLHYSGDAVAIGAPADTVSASFVLGGVTVSPGLAPRNVATNFTAAGGVVGGDAIAFQTSSATRCASACQALDNPPAQSILSAQLNFVQRVTATVSCACYLAAGNAPTNWTVAGAWAPITVNITAVSADAEYVTGWTGPTGAPSGTTITFNGKFEESSTTADYGILLGGSRGRAASGQVPTCTVMSKTTSWLECQMSVQVGTSGEWQPTVVRGAAATPIPLSSGALDFIIAVPPTPTFTRMTGECADDAAKCVSGARLTIVGGNFDYVTAGLNTVVLTAEASGTAATCSITSVTETVIVCTLARVTGSTLPMKGVYTVSIEISPDPLVAALTRNIGQLTLYGDSGARGFSGNAATDPPPGPPGKKDKSDTNLALIVAVVLLGIIVVGGVIFVIRNRATAGGASAARNNRQFETNAGGDDYLPMTEHTRGGGQAANGEEAA